MRVVGHVDGFYGEGVSGWACMPEKPATRLWVELLVDECSIGTACAENFHVDAEAYGDGCSGFWLPLPPVLRDAPCTVQVRVINTDIFLEPTVALESPKPHAVLLGTVASDMGLNLSGWVRDPAEPERHLRVSAWLGGEELVETLANERCFRPADSDGHGFSLTLPMRLADGVEHLVEVLDSESRPLPGSPVLVCALPQGVSGWLATQKKLEGPQRELVATFLKNYEAWLPKGVRLDMFAAWRECFPVPVTNIPKGLRVAKIDGRAATPETLRNAASKHDFLLWHTGEVLHPHLMGHLVRALSEPDACLVYADGVARESDGGLLPLCHAAWDIYRFLCADQLGPFLVRTSLLNTLNLETCTPAELRTTLILAAHERNGIRHLPLFLSERAEALNPDGHLSASQRWLQDHFPEVSMDAHPAASDVFRIHFSCRQRPLVSLLVPTRDKASLLRDCLRSLDTSSYENMEIVILDNDSGEAETRTLFHDAEAGGLCRFPVRVLRWSGAFNYAAINNFGAREAAGELLCLLNNDTEILSPDWLDEMLGILLNPLDGEIGCAGAKLLWPNELVQHGGVVVGTHQLAAHIGNQWGADAAGYMNLNRVTRQVSAVTAACLLTPKALFLECGGFDALHFPVAFNDVDYCLRLRQAGKRTVWTPNALLVHHESASRGRDESPPQKARSAMEMHHFRTRWGGYDDPFYSPNLSLSTVLEPFAGLSLPPRVRRIRS